VLRAYPVDEHGRRIEQHQLFAFRAVVANHSIAARDAAAIRYAMVVPTKVALPLEVRARLRHRTRGLEHQRVTCEAARRPDGAAFLRQALALRDMVVDPCAPQPITEIAATTVWLGDGAAARATPSTPRGLGAQLRARHGAHPGDRRAARRGPRRPRARADRDPGRPPTAIARGR
jgi:hypothetical protein